MYSFAYHRPTSLAELKSLLGRVDEARLLAGGQTLIPTLKQRLASPDAVIDLKGIAALAAIERQGEALVIGALAKHAAVAASPVVRQAIPALAALAAGIGDPQVRNRGTLGGSIANNDPAADYPAALLGLGATVTTSERSIPADDFFTGLFETDLEPGEIVTAVSFPIPRRAAYVKFPNPASRYAIVGVFLAETGRGVRVAVTGAGPCVFRLSSAEAALSRAFTPASLDGLSVAAIGLNSDLHAGADYRAHLVAIMARRAVQQALA
ncbi:MAG: FAD binding domain-containing protein [Stellaceae bacterium]